jgi:hypothetical protein
VTNSSNVVAERANYSTIRLKELRKRIGALPEVANFADLTIFGAGSFARLEASEFSDIDLFFLSAGKKDDLIEPRTKGFRLFGKIIDVIDALGFPKFSNDCEYLVVLSTDDILSHLGGRTDDHENFFTARMLLLLESHCLYGDQVFADVTAKIVRSYFKDFPDHRETFQPIFLLNDICRFWKTLLLNYENKRSVPAGGEAVQARETKQKVRNFKLKFSRMTTCFASIAALGSHVAPVSEEDVIAMTKLTPRQRLESLVGRVPRIEPRVKEVLDRYSWFLEMTGLPTEQIESKFADKQKRIEMFREANAYGDSMFRLISSIDESDPKLRLIRYLVV